MTIRGQIVAVESRRTVNTRYDDSDVAAVKIRVNDHDDPVRVSLWGKWSETVEWVEPGMDLAVYRPAKTEFDGETGYETTADSYVVVEPDFLVDVTAIREWVQCPRQYYLSKLDGSDISYPLVKGTIVHQVFGDLLRGRSVEDAVEARVAEAGLNIGLLGRDRDAVVEDVKAHSDAIQSWLQQGTLTEADEWRSELTLLSPQFGIKGRADAIRRTMPVELKTGKNTRRDPRFHDKVQAACYALMLTERGMDVDTGTLLYTKNAALDRNEETGDLSPAKEFSITKGLLDFVVRARNQLAATEFDHGVPSGHEANAKCTYCFVRDRCMVVAGRLEQESKAGAIGTALPEDERAYFSRMYELIETERRFVHAEYRRLWEESPAERAANDRALIDLEPVGRTRTDDDRWRLEAVIPSGAVSKIRRGDVVLASDGDPIDGTAEMGRVVELGEHVVVETDEPLDLRRLDVYPSEMSVDRLLTALHDALLKGDPDQKAVLFGRREPAFGEESETYIETNDTQNQAVNLAVNAEDYALVHGPPGTGKTYTIARTIRALVEDGNRVLLSAFTNRAVDNALEALRAQGYEDVCRVGTAHGVREDMLDLRLERGGDPDTQAATFTEASVVAATTASCGSSLLREQSFDVALVDEAAQLTEPGTLAAVTLADRFVLVGDHQQLPPVVQSATELSESLFERLIEATPEASVMLDQQYRMNQRIQAFSSCEFYDNALKPANYAVASQTLADLPGVDVDRLPMVLRGRVALVDPSGNADGNVNLVEADRVADVVSSFIDAGVNLSDIGVIAPFRAQVAAITNRVGDGVTVDTVDRFQGSSKEVVVVSFVATGVLDSPVFEDYRRVNVALTRAKKSLVLVGDESALRSDEVFARMLDWARSREAATT